MFSVNERVYGRYLFISDFKVSQNRVVSAIQGPLTEIHFITRHIVLIKWYLIEYTCSQFKNVVCHSLKRISVKGSSIVPVIHS